MDKGARKPGSKGRKERAGSRNNWRPTYVVVAFVVITAVAGLIATLILSRSSAAGNTCVWTNGAGTGLWNNSANWSGCASAVPGVSTGVNDTAVFNATSTANVSINAVLSLAAFQMNAGYTGTVTQANTLTTSAFTQASGTFVGANFIVDVNGAFSLTGGSFTAPSTTLSVSGAFTISGAPTFTHNGGTVTFDGTTSAALACNSATFNRVTLVPTSTANKTIGTDCSLPLGANPIVGTDSANFITLNGTLTGTGTLTMGPTFGTTTAFIQNSTGALSGFSAALFNGNATFSGGTVNLTSYTSFVVRRNFEANTAAAVTAPTGTLTVGGHFRLLTGSTYVHSGGTLTMDGGGSMACNNQVFNVVLLRHPSSSVDVGADCTIPLGNNPTVGIGGSSGGGLTVDGTITGSGTLTVGVLPNTTGELRLNATGVLSGFSGIVANRGFTQNAGTQNFAAYSPFTVNDAFTIQSSGNFTAPTGTMTVGGTFSVAVGSTFVHSGGTLTFVGTATASMTCNSQTFNRVTFAHTSGIKTINVGCTFPMGSNPTTATGGSIVNQGTMSGTGTLSIGSSGTGSNFTVSGSSANLTGFGAMTVFGSYTVSKSLSAAAYTLLNVEGSFVHTAGTFTAPTPGTMVVKRDFTLSGAANFTPGSGTLEFGQSGVDAVLGCNNDTFNNAVFSATSNTKTINSNCNLPLGANPTTGTGGKIVLAGTLSGTGTLRMGASGTDSNLTLQSTAALTGFNGLAVNGAYLQSGGSKNFSTYSTIDLNHDLTVDSAGTFIAPTGTMSVARNINLPSATFTHSNGTLVLDGTNQTIATPSLTLYRLSKTETTNDGVTSTLTLPGSTTLTIGAGLTLVGLDSNDRIALVSSTPGTASNFDLTGASTFTGSNLSVTDNRVTESSSGAALPLNPADSINGGGTQGWFSVLAELSNASASGQEDAAITLPTLLVSGTLASDASIEFADLGTGSATRGSGQDFEMSSPVVVVVPAGTYDGTAATDIELSGVTVLDDQVDEPNETIILGLQSPSSDLALGDANANADTQSNFAYTITDNDTAGITITESDGSTSVTEGGATDTYTIVLTSQPTVDVVVFVTSNEEVAVDPIPLVFTTANWQSPQTVVVIADDDAAVDTDPGIVTHGVTSGDPVYQGFAVGDVTVTVTDNDTAGITVAESDGSTDVTEGGATDSYTLVLTSQPASDVTVAVTPNGQVTVDQTELTFTPANWQFPQWVTVAAVDDAVADTTQGQITHVASSSDVNYQDAAIVDVVVEVTDNDTAGITVTESDGGTAGTEGGTTDTYTVVLNSRPTEDVEVTLTTDAQVTATPSPLTFTSSDWDTAQTVTVTAVDDSTEEASEVSSIGQSVTSSDPGYSAFSLDDVDVTVTDNDASSEPTPTPLPPAPVDSVQRISDASPEAQAIAVSKLRFATDHSAQAVAIARQDNIVDSLTSDPLVNLTDASSLLTSSSSLNPDTLAELTRVIINKSSPVFIIGGLQALDETVTSDLAANGFTNVVRLAGTDRRDTAVLIGELIYFLNASRSDTVYLTEDQRFADSLSLGAIAGQHADATVEPILLTNRGSSVPDLSMMNFLLRHRTFNRIVLIGGTQALPAELEQNLAGLFPDSEVVRYAGADRFATNVALLDAFFPAPSAIVVALGTEQGLIGASTASSVGVASASGHLFSALFAGTFAADEGIPVVLTNPSSVPPLTLEYITKHAASIVRAYIVGSTSQISAAVEEQIKAAITAI